MLCSSLHSSLDPPGWLCVPITAAVSGIFTGRWRDYSRDGMLREGHDVVGQEGRISAQLDGYFEVSFVLSDTRMANKLTSFASKIKTELGIQSRNRCPP
jgi:hypothetical protein